MNNNSNTRINIRRENVHLEKIRKYCGTPKPYEGFSGGSKSGRGCGGKFQTHSPRR